MPAAIAVALIGGWLLVQTVAGRLPARLLSFRAPADGVPTVSLEGWSSPDLPSMKSTPAPTGDVPATGTLGGQQVARIALSLGLSDEAAAIATAIAWRESRFNPAAHNPVPPDDSYGLWQINRLAHPQYTPAELRTPLGNARAMVALSSGGTNWQPWTVPGQSWSTGLDLELGRKYVRAAKGG